VTDLHIPDYDNIVGDQQVGDKLILGIQEKIFHQEKGSLLLNYSGISRMGKDLNKIDWDYYSVQQDDNLPVKSFKFPKIRWNNVSKEHLRVL